MPFTSADVVCKETQSALTDSETHTTLITKTTDSTPIVANEIQKKVPRV